jgi:hypothetical protein
VRPPRAGGVPAPDPAPAQAGIVERTGRLRASVGSTEAANEAVARFGVVGPKRATRLQIRCCRGRSGAVSSELDAMQVVDTRRSSTWVPAVVRCVKDESRHRIDEIRPVVKVLTSNRRRKASISGQT